MGSGLLSSPLFIFVTFSKFSSRYISKHKYMFVRKLHRNIRAVAQIVSKMDAAEDKISLKKYITEGKAVMSLSTDKVFYNPVQEFNRDLSIAVLNVFTAEYAEEKLAQAQLKAERKQKEGKNNNNTGHAEETESLEGMVTILEPLSATGLRAIRYAKEVANVSKIIANDLSRNAVEVIKENIVSNGLEGKVESNHDDACMVMYKHKDKKKRFAAIDLDPYGCPSIFLDAAVQAVQDGGLLLITATDMAVLAGNSPETCHAKYGAVSLKTKACHEMALRILLQCISSHASRYGRYIVPMLSISADFYIRVFVKVYSGQEQVKRTSSKLSMVYQCTGCGTMSLQALGGWKPNPTERRPEQMKSYLPPAPPVETHCVHCNSSHRLGGPIWSAPIHDMSFVSNVLSHVTSYSQNFGTAKRIQGVLSMVNEELHIPLYYSMEQLGGTAHVETMKMNLMRSAIMNAGYQVSYSHAWKNSVKTDAPAQFIWDIIRSWAIQHPVKPERLQTDPVARHLMTQEIKHTIDWTPRKDANPESRREHCLRFQTNPTRYWGPGCRAAVNVGELTNTKRIAKQDTRRCKRKHSPTNEEEGGKKGNTVADSNELSDGNIEPDEEKTNKIV